MAETTSFMDAIRKDVGIQTDNKERDQEDKNLENQEEENDSQDEDLEDDSDDSEDDHSDNSDHNQNNEESEDEDEEEDDDEDGPLTLNKNQKKKSKTRGTQIKELRSSRDEWKTKYNDLKSKYDVLQKSASEEGSEILSIVEEKFGELGSSTRERVENLVNAVEERDQIRDELESLKRDIDIRQSDDWKTNYEQPYNDSLESFYASIVNTDDDGKVPNERYFQSFAQELLTGAIESGDINATQVKSAINKFAKIYEDQTGEEYEKPSVSDVTKSIRTAIRLKNEAEKAYGSWENERKTRAEQRKLQDAEKNEKLTKIQKKERKRLAGKALTEFDSAYTSKLEDIFDEDDITSEFNEVFNSNESQLEDPSKAMPYDQLLSTIVKGRMFDALLEKYNEITENKNLINKTKKGIKGSEKPNPNPDKNRNREPGKRSWLPDEKTYGIRRG